MYNICMYFLLPYILSFIYRQYIETDRLEYIVAACLYVTL